jgi:hypothetical protein
LVSAGTFTQQIHHQRALIRWNFGRAGQNTLGPQHKQLALDRGEPIFDLPDVAKVAQNAFAWAIIVVAIALGLLGIVKGHIRCRGVLEFANQPANIDSIALAFRSRSAYVPPAWIVLLV